MIRALVYGAALFFVPFALLILAWLVAPRGTDRSRIRAGAPRRALRWYRGLWLRSGAAIAGWPHALEVAVGAHRAAVPATTWEPLWKSGRATLYRITGTETDQLPVLVVHSLVSKPWILDLTTEQSFLGALRHEGFPTYLLDWGDFGSAEAEHDLSHYANVLMEAESKVLASSEAERLHLVGYCLGGTLCLARAAARAHPRVASIALIATPCDFAVPGPLHTMMSHGLLKPVSLLDGSSGVPAAVVRESFHALRPQAFRSVLELLRNRRNPAFRAFYDSLGRWVWEHRRMPGGIFFDLVDLFRTNSLFEGNLEVAGEIARLKDIKVPLAAFVAERDHIVPSGSTHALRSVHGLEVEFFTMPSGHVSMICGRAAREVMWPRLFEWLSSIR